MHGIISKETENTTTNTITPLKTLHFKKDIMELGKVQKKSNQKDWGETVKTNAVVEYLEKRRISGDIIICMCV